MKHSTAVIPAYPESFLILQKDSRRASLAGMTTLLYLIARFIKQYPNLNHIFIFPVPVKISAW